MLHLYQWVMRKSEGLLERLLEKRLNAGKEDPVRIDERRGVASRARPDGTLLWLHAASVGEAQSALILIKAILLDNPDLQILVTTGTLTSAQRMEEVLPEQAFHQYMPVDYPEWVTRFLDHWSPDLVLWMESELWPHILQEIEARNIPAALINARLSDRSFARWKLFKKSARAVLECFDLVLTQTELDAERYRALGAQNVHVSDNIKYSAGDLPHDEGDLKVLKGVLMSRPVLVYASTHAGEEEIIMRTQSILESSQPELISIIIPRHPDRGEAILDQAIEERFQAVLRGEDKALPDEDTQIYIANTMGELGLFYRLAEIVFIGRSLSDDGGGGHNPIEAAQLGCAIVHGAKVQNLQEIFDDMETHKACLRVKNEQELVEGMQRLLEDPALRNSLIQNAQNFSNAKSHVIDTVIQNLEPLFTQSGLRIAA